MTGSIWDQVLARIETKVNQHIYSTWFKPTSFVADDGHLLRIRVPNALFSNWLNKHYSVVLTEALAEVNRPGCAISFVTEDGERRAGQGCAAERRAVCTGAANPKRSSPAHPGAWRRDTPSTPSSSGRPTSLRTPRAAPLPKRRRAPTIRSSSTAASDSAKRI